MIVNGKEIIGVRHPSWTSMRKNWEKWRAIYKGGDDFNEAYIKTFSNLEDNQDFKKRKEISPSPTFAKMVVNSIKDAIFQRMGEVTRKDGPKSYQLAVNGEGYGVDLHGTDMNAFLAREVLPELLTMAKVGIFVDKPPITGPTLIDAKGKFPYLYVYKAEEIYSWAYRKDRIEEFQAVLLVDYVDDCEAGSGLPQGQWKRHRICWIDEAGTWCRMYDDEGTQIDLEGQPSMNDIKINLPYIPFFTADLTDSLLADIANHQIALVNAESCDMAYILRSNFPVYTEQKDDRDFSQYLKQGAGSGDDATAAGTALRDERDIKMGNSVGRAYRSGMERPGFINPSSEPVAISMAKQKQLKEDIRELVNLSLSSIKPKMASAESKALDMQGLESGMSYIGLELQRIERKIAKVWADYEGENEPAVIAYPTKWSLESEDDKRKDAEQLEELRDSIPSPTFQKLISVKIANKLIGDEIDLATREKIAKEIQDAESITCDPDIINQAVVAGILDLQLAAVLLGFPKTAPEKAAKEHADRLARIAASQQVGPAGAAGVGDAGARGVGDKAGDANGGANEKAASRDTTKDATPQDKTRGQGQ
jgi:hypothetical protein